MSDDKRFVNLSKSSGNWADEEDAGSAPEPKAAKSWGTVQQVKPVSLAEIQEDEAKNVQPKETNQRQPRGDFRGDRDHGHEPREHRDYPPRDRGDRGDRDSREHREPREPRQKNPVPEQPPYVAFLGNLAFSVVEDTVWEFFGELGVDQVRMVTDSQTGKPKGFAYVHFKDKDGLVNALTCDGMDFYGRRLNVDVAAPKAREERGQWGPRDGASGGGRRGFGDRGFGDRGFGDRGGDRGDRGDRNYGPRGDRGPPAERKPLNLAPRTKPLDGDSAPAPSSSGEPKHTGSDPFGGATSDRAKMDQVAGERLKKEQEREAKRKEEIKQSEERRQREREERDRSRDDRKPERGGGNRRGGGEDREPRQAPPRSDKEVEIDSRSSWRSNRSNDEPSSRPNRGAYNGGGGRGGGGRGGGRAPEKKWVEDSDGFKTKKEDSKPAASTGGSWAAVAAKPSEDAKSAENPYGALGGEQ